jgi:hypothetical protein
VNRRLLTAAAAVAIAVGIGAAVAVGHRPDTSATGSAAGTTSLGGAGLSVRPGEGAAALAANGFTPIAYPATCQGAVAAIASAEQVFPQLGAVKGVTDEQWRQTIERVYGQDNPTAAYYLGIVRRAADDAAIQRVAKDRLADLDTTTHPEWGGFRVVSCQPGKTATVELLACLRQVADRHTACYADARQAGWDAGPGDWVIQQHQAPGDVAPPVLRERIDDETDALAGSAPPARVRGAWLTALGAGWQEFSNAPK